LERKNIPTPKTIEGVWKKDSFRISNQIEEMEFPLVIKPRRGAGCQGLSLIKSEREIKKAIEKIRDLKENEFVIQQFIRGKAASICLISTGQEALPLTLNKQFVNLSSPPLESDYSGGMLPFSHAQKEKAFRISRLAVESFPGLRGLIGIDLVFADEGPVVIEINPRITLSYVGLRNVISINPAQMMIEAIIKDQLPTKPKISNYSLFSKVKVSSPFYRRLEKVYDAPGVISPPFPIEKKKESLCLLVAVTRKRNNLKEEFNRIQKNLENLVME
jgi:predicted ATP-grasp superfamily ATP-dependent carboligase